MEATAKILHIDQRSIDWQEARLGRITSSRIADLMTNDRSGNGLGLTAIKMLAKIKAEIITGVNDDLNLDNNYHIQRGVEFEPIARQRYEEETFSTVEECGFIDYSEFVGGSPDGLVDNDGLIEIKCKSNSNHYLSVKACNKDIKTGIDKQYMWQMQFLMFISDRKWCDYILYNDMYPSSGYYRDFHIYRVKSDKSMIDQIRNRVADAVIELDEK